MAVLEGRAPNRRPHHAVEVAVTPSAQPRGGVALSRGVVPNVGKSYVLSIDIGPALAGTGAHSAGRRADTGHCSASQE